MLLDQVFMNPFTPLVFPSTLALLCPSRRAANLLGELTILYVDNIEKQCNGADDSLFHPLFLLQQKYKSNLRMYACM